MAEKLFVCVQLELPCAVGPPDGRYVLRPEPGAEPAHVLVLRTTTARKPSGRRASRRRAARRAARRARERGRAEPTEVTVAQATVIDAVALSAERQAHAWLENIDPARESASAFAVLARVRFAHRIANADPAVHELDPADAIAIRAGFGTGTQLADGRLAQARELQTSAPRTPGLLMQIVPVPGRRTRRLRPQERFAALLAARSEPLVCEELALRARSDFDHGRLKHAAIELDSAIDAALAELPGGLAGDAFAALRELQEPVAQAAERALGGSRGAAGPSPGAAAEPDRDLIRRALGRLEATLRDRLPMGGGVS